MNLLRGQKQQRNHEIKQMHKHIYKWIHVHRHLCPHTQTELCVPFSYRRPRGFMVSCVRVCSGPCDVATAREAPGWTNRRAKTSIRNSGGTVEYPAAWWQLIKHHAQSAAEVKIKSQINSVSFLQWSLITVCCFDNTLLALMQFIHIRNSLYCSNGSLLSWQGYLKKVEASYLQSHTYSLIYNLLNIQSQATADCNQASTDSL